MHRSRDLIGRKKNPPHFPGALEFMVIRANVSIIYSQGGPEPQPRCEMCKPGNGAEGGQEKTKSWLQVQLCLLRVLHSSGQQEVSGAGRLVSGLLWRTERTGDPSLRNVCFTHRATACAVSIIYSASGCIYFRAVVPILWVRTHQWLIS